MNGDLRFAWDAHNIEHLALHNVRPGEAEQALAGELMDLDYRITPDGDERWAPSVKPLAAVFSLLSGPC